MDFFSVDVIPKKRGELVVAPAFDVSRSKDIMTRGRDFYAVWNPEKGLWSTDLYDLISMVDGEVLAKAKEIGASVTGVSLMRKYSSKVYQEFRDYIRSIPDNNHQLDTKITWANTDIKKTDYVSRRLSYSLEEGPIDAYEELIGTLYSPTERQKLEWAIGCIASGDSTTVQKFIVLYGESGAGKSTVLNIIGDLFEGYCMAFNAQELGQRGSTFATEMFRDNPLIAIQHDGDLSKIEDNTILNSIVSHEKMIIHEKYKAAYTSRINTFILMGTNKPVKITDAKSGIIRRLIDIQPTGRKVSPARYEELMGRISFEHPGIVWHCLQVYKELGKNFYKNYRPLGMIFKTDAFFNFVEDSIDELSKDSGITLAKAYDIYKAYCDTNGLQFKLEQYKFREELKNYFEHFALRARLPDGSQPRNLFTGFRFDIFEEKSNAPDAELVEHDLGMTHTVSNFDVLYADCPAQYAKEDGSPSKPWDKVRTRLKDLDTTRLHYVLMPDIFHVCVDFDLRDEDGNKSKKLNLEAAAKWPKTYAEFSKSGAGIHLHYIFTGDASKLATLFAPGIEVKTFPGKAALRRKLSYCNDIGINCISSGLPFKEEKKVLDTNAKEVKSEKSLRNLISRNLSKEIMGSTKSSMDFIKKILDDAYNSGLSYDVSNMESLLFSFASSSTNNSKYCLDILNSLKLRSKDREGTTYDIYCDNGGSKSPKYVDDRLCFFDIEVFPNLLLVITMFEGSDTFNVFINPDSSTVEKLFNLKLVGFNCRRYDNHILYARYLGYDNEQIYQLSQKIIDGRSNALFTEAYNISYTDVYDYSSKKQSLKAFEIELGLYHVENEYPWDQPLPEDKWEEVIEYCKNDVRATSEVHKSREADFLGRQILAALTGMTVNDTTNSLTTRLILGKQRHPALHWSDLSEVFPGYEYTDGKNMYRGVDVGKGGYVYANPGMYFGETVTFDVASMHPHSIIELGYLGEYTQAFKNLVEARIAIKHGDYDFVRNLYGEVVDPYLNDPKQAKMLSGALKIAINSLYGLTAASFDNPFRDPRNVNNIVALRGALFMKTLQDEVEAKGFKVIHIKTDSIKIWRPTKDLTDFVMDFGKKYGYTFEVEHIFERICLIDKAEYIAKLAKNDPESPGEWTATGAAFQEPYIFKTLFTGEDIEFEDLCIAKSVTSAMYLDFNEGLPDGEHRYVFVGKAGQFCPVKSGCNGGRLLRQSGPDKYSYVGGAKDVRWRESSQLKAVGKTNDIDTGYFDKLLDEAKETLSKFGAWQSFVYDEIADIPPWLPCDDCRNDCANCFICDKWDPDVGCLESLSSDYESSQYVNRN